MSNRAYRIMIYKRVVAAGVSSPQTALAISSLMLFAVQGSDLHAQQYGEIAAGHDLAQAWLSSCHLISPELKTGIVDGAPSFSSVANMPSTTRTSLSAFLQTSHRQIPNFQLTRLQIANLTAYILNHKSGLTGATTR